MGNKDTLRKPGFWAVVEGIGGAFIPGSAVRELMERGNSKSEIRTMASTAIASGDTRTGDNVSEYLLRKVK